MTQTCLCGCHDGPRHPCSIEGGCGHLHPGCGVCGAPSGDGLHLCRTHTDNLERDLRGVEDLVRELDITLTRQDRVNPANSIGKSAERPLAWNENAAAKRFELWATLNAWALDTSKLGEDDRDQLIAVPADDTPGVAGWLIRNLPTLRRHREAGIACDEITDAIGGARRAIDRPAAATRFRAGPCPELVITEKEPGSDVTELVYCDGDVWAFIPIDPDELAYLRCQGCDSSWDTTQWMRIGQRMLARIAELRRAA